MDDAQAAGPGFDPMAMLRLFWRRKWLFIIPFILCFSMAAVAIKIMTPIYYSAGQVQMILHNAETDLINNPARRYGGSRRNIDRMALEEMDLLLTSPEFLEIVVRELELYRALVAEPDPETGPMTEEQAVHRAMSRLKSMLRIEVNGSNLFLIGATNTDPQQAYDLTVFILDRFLAEYRTSRLAARTTTRDFLQRQLDSYQTELVKAENALTSFQSNMASATLADSEINARNLSVAQDNLEQLRGLYNGEDEAEINRLQVATVRITPRLPDVQPYRSNPSILSIVREMQDLGLQKQMLATGDRGLDDLDARLGQLRLRLNNRIEERVAADYPALGYMDRNQLSQYIYFSIFRQGRRWVIDELDRQIQAFRDFTARQPGQSSRLSELQDDVDSARSLVTTMEREIAEQNLNLEASLNEIGFQIKVRQRPRFPTVPIEPNKTKLLLMGFLLSLGLGTGLVVLAILLDRSFTRVEDIERTLGLTVIGTLPVIPNDIFEHQRKLRILRWVTIVLGIIAVGAVGFLVVYPRLS